MAIGQSAFYYTDDIFACLEKCLSYERLASYYDLARGDKWMGIQLYEKNAELSESLYGVIQALEVTLRNSIHDALTGMSGTPEWYDDNQKIRLEESEREAVEAAKKKIKEKLLSVTSGRVVAELTFGFWAKLTSFGYENSLWFPCLYRILPPGTRRKLFHGKLMEFKTLRNRIAHHERIIGRTRPLPEEYENILEVMGWLNTDICRWVEHRSSFRERYARKLRRTRPLAPVPDPAAPSDGNPEAKPK